MAVHVPLSAEAQAEARVLMLATNNVLMLMKQSKHMKLDTLDFKHQ